MTFEVIYYHFISLILDGAVILHKSSLINH